MTQRTRGPMYRALLIGSSPTKIIYSQLPGLEDGTTLTWSVGLVCDVFVCLSGNFPACFLITLIDVSSLSLSQGTLASALTRHAPRWLCGPYWPRLSSCLMTFETWITARGPSCKTKWPFPSIRTPWESRADACCRSSSLLRHQFLYSEPARHH